MILGVISSEFLSESSHSPINVDSKVREVTRKNMKGAGRYTFDSAQDHIYTLMRSDSYPRFLKSDQYKELLNPKKKVHIGYFLLYVPVYSPLLSLPFFGVNFVCFCELLCYL